MNIDKLINHASSIVEKAFNRLPQAEVLLLQTLDVLFVPKQIATQFAIVVVLQGIVMIWRAAANPIGTQLQLFLSSNSRKEKEFMHHMTKTVKTYREWKVYAEQLDKLRGYDKWRSEDEDLLFDSRILKKRITDTVQMIKQDDIFNLMFRLRGALARDQYGMQNEGLFTKATVGTKYIIENYHETVVSALNYICDSPSGEDIPMDAKLAFFNETRHAYGRTALLLSGGAYLGYYHMGVSKALWEEGLLPRVISGASAGSLMAAMIGTKTDEGLDEAFHPEFGHTKFRRDFFRYSSVPTSSIAKKLQKLIPENLRWIGDILLCFIFDGKIVNLDTEHFKRVVLDNVGTCTFQEAFDRTGRIINITVAPLNNYDPPRLLNYLTAPHVCVWSAAVASCALPGFFESSLLIVKEPNGVFRPEHEWTRQGLLEADTVIAGGQTYSDGSLENDLPMQQLSELFNVNHFIISQANPHSALLSTLSLRANVWTSSVYGVVVAYVRFLKAQCRDWLRNIVSLINFRSNAPAWSTKRGFFQTLTQDYEGREIDVTIMPWVGHIGVIQAFWNVLKNPTDAEYSSVVAHAETNTWPFISRIKAHCMVEMTLDKCVQRLRKRFSREPDTGKMIDRTPSFYTSRSIVNLSGLSVADPVPLKTQLHKKATHVSQNSPNSADGLNQHNDSSKNSLSGILEKEMDDENKNIVSSTDDYNNMFSLSDDTSPRIVDDLIPKTTFDEVLKVPTHKTTTMANFYYKKSKSSDNLDDQARSTNSLGSNE